MLINRSRIKRNCHIENKIKKKKNLDNIKKKLRISLKHCKKN